MSNKPTFTLSRQHFKGSSFEIGLQLGQFGATAVHQRLLRSSAWETVQRFHGTARSQKMMILTQKHFPDIWAEIEGLAQGLELPLEAVFLWNARGDVWAMAPDGCTTIMDPGSGQPRITHNEDGTPMFAGYCAIAQFEVDQKHGFASFIYPGSIAGHTLAVNRSGLAMTVNNIRALTVQAGIPRMVATRAVLNTENVLEAVQLLRSLPLSGAFHLSLADSSTGQLASVEYSSHYVSVQTLRQTHIHANHAIHPDTRDWPQIITGTSGRRQLRGQALLDQGQTNPLTILADDDKSGYPIFRRSPDDTDDENTLATADISVQQDGVRWQVYQDPRQPATFELAHDQFLD